MHLMTTNKANVIFIMLGQSCNLSCKYCIQHSAIERFLPKSKINEDIFAFIKTCCDNVDHSINLRFFGGEPLLYFNDIKTIIEKTKGLNVTYSIITNGKMFNEEIVDVFNKNNVSVTISWDGRNVDLTRHYDVMKDKFDIIKHLNKLCVSGVLTANNYIEDFVDDAIPYEALYFAEHGNCFSVVADEFMNIEDNHDLTDIDYDKLNNQMKNMINIYKNKSAIATYDRIKKVVVTRYLKSKLKTIKNNQWKSEYETPCSNGMKMLNMDLHGNLYHCHNNWVKLGDIYSDFGEYDYSVFCENKTFHVYKDCAGCSAYPICHGGCPLVKGKQRIEYCKLKKAMINPIIKNLI